MSGHSKWHNIKLKKGKVDAQRGALFTKLSKEIILAAKCGSPDPEANYRLKMAVEKAREFNVPQDNIKRADRARRAARPANKKSKKSGTKDTGRTAVAVVVDAATDNRNRTAGELRFLFHQTRRHARRDRERRLDVRCRRRRRSRPRGKGPKTRLRRTRLVDGVEDVEYDADVASIYTAPAQLASARDALHARGLKFPTSTSACAPKQQVESGRATNSPRRLTFSRRSDEHEDAQRVFSNLDLSERVAGGACLKNVARLPCRHDYLPRDWIFPIVLAIFVAVVVWFGRQIHDFLLPPADTVTVPPFVGQTLTDANAGIARLNLSSAVVDHTPRATAIPKASLSCSGPTPANEVRQGRQISFVISDGIIARLDAGSCAISRCAKCNSICRARGCSWRR